MCAYRNVCCAEIELIENNRHDMHRPRTSPPCQCARCHHHHHHHLRQQQQQQIITIVLTVACNVRYFYTDNQERTSPPQISNFTLTQTHARTHNVAKGEQISQQGDKHFLPSISEASINRIDIVLIIIDSSASRKRR